MPKDNANSPGTSPEYRIARRRWVTRPGLHKLLMALEGSDEPYRTLYLKPDSQNPGPDAGPEVSEVLREVPKSETGLAIFMGDGSAIAVAPPFPIGEDAFAEGVDGSPLRDLLDRNRTVGIVLLRLGRYAVGVVQGENLLASKSGSRHVKNRHKQGGSSQRRFERSRERLVREIFDKACEVMRTVFTPYENRMDYIMLGGEKTTLRGLEERCAYLTKTDIEVMARRLAVERPGKVALGTIHREVWKSHVYALERVPNAR
jgi:hypothetical protein